jgi:hypothetical protein
MIGKLPVLKPGFHESYVVPFAGAGPLAVSAETQKRPVPGSSFQQDAVQGEKHVAIVRCRDYAQYGQQLSSAFDQIGGLDKLVRGKDRWTQAQSHRESEELAADA